MDDAIERLVCHRDAMLLLDTLEHVGDDELVALLTVRADGLFDRAGRVPAYIGIEYMAQAMSALNGHTLLQQGKHVRLGFLAGTRSYTCDVADFFCGERLRVIARRQILTDDGLGVFDCRIESADPAQRRIHCEARISAYAPDNPEFYYHSARETGSLR